MNDDVRKKYEEEMIKEAERFMEEVNRNPELQNVKAPEEMHDKLFEAIRKKEEERARANMSDEDKELIRLGKIYKKRRKRNKYLVLAAVMVLVLALGITSVGGPKKVFETFKIMTMGREQIQVNSDEDVETGYDWTEDKVYGEIEEEFGFFPVRLAYLSDGVEFQEIAMFDELLGIQLIYGKGDEANIFYTIRPNYRDSSLGKDVEDKLLEEYEVETTRALIRVQKYLIEDGTVRWMVMFEYQDVTYAITMLDMEQEEVEKLILNLYFPQA